jgi:MFS superfamily sulfate permease-like transporter
MEDTAARARSNSPPHEAGEFRRAALASRASDPASIRPVLGAHDIVAGLVLTTMLVPVGIAYAEASGVPGIYGLYATIVPLLAYALFGPSRILVLGPDSSLAP